MKKVNKILGLDLGIASLGWAINKYDKNKDLWYIEDFGVRLWDSPENSKSLNSSAKERREKRSIRRSIRRKALRKLELTNIFINNKLLKRDEIDNHYKKLLEKNNNYNSENNNLNPLYLRNKALEKKITPLQLHIITTNLSKSRGYENKFSIDSEKRLDKSKDLIKKYKYPIKAILNFEKFNSGNLKNSYRSTDDAKKNERDFLFLRRDVENEYKKILDTQVKHKVLDRKVADLLFERLFRQRFFEDGPTPSKVDSTNLKEVKEWKAKIKNNKQNYYSTFHEAVGNCTYYPSETRVPKSSVLNDLFVISNELSKVTDKFQNLTNGTKEEINEKRKNIFNDVINEYLTLVKFNKSTLEKIFEKNNEILSEKNGVEFKPNNFFLYKLNSKFPKFVKEELKKINCDLNKIKGSKLEKVGEIFSNYMTPSKILLKFKEYLKDDNRPNEEIIEDIKKSNISSGRSSVSKKFILDSLIVQKDKGIKLQDFSSKILEKNNKNSIDERLKKLNKNLSIIDALKYVFKPNINNDKDMMSNGVVFRSINQTRLVIRSLLKEYGWFDSINIEIARDLYAGTKERISIRNNQDSFAKDNESIKNELEKNGISQTNSNIRKYKLWSHQKLNESDPFAIDFYDINLKEKINLKDVYATGVCEEDHIIPYSVLNDNTIWNRVITKRKYNQLKGKKSPIEYFESQGYSKKEINNWRRELRKLPIFKKIKSETISRKYNNLTMGSSLREDNDPFESKDLNNTRYISKYLLGYFKQEFEILSELINKNKVNINSIIGSVTSSFRREWLEGSAWGLDEKVREITPYHHSVDAIILSQFKNFSDIQFFTFYQSQYKYFRFLNKSIFNKNISIDKAKEELDEQYNNFINFSKEGEKIYVYVSNFLKEGLKEGLRLYTKDLKNNLGNKKFKPLTFLKPLNKNLKEEVENLIPVKLNSQEEIKEIKYKDKLTKEDKVKEIKEYVPKFDKELSVKEWSKLNNRKDSQFPFPSYKINKRIRGSFAKENPAKHKDIKEGDVIDSKNNAWKTSEYFGINLDKNSTKSRVSYHDAWRSQKDGIKYNNVLSRNECFELEGKNYIYKGSNLSTMFCSSLLRNYSGTSKYNDIFGFWPYINIKNRLILKKKSVNILGKNLF